MPHLKQQTIQALKRAFAEANLSYDDDLRGLLLANINYEFVQSLQRYNKSSAQLAGDLNTLNSLKQLADGSVPLKIWLENAADQFGIREQSQVFKDALTEMAWQPETVVITENGHRKWTIQDLLKNVIQFLWRLGPVVKVVIIVGAVGVTALILYFLLWPTSITGSISCDPSNPRSGQRVRGATVKIPNTNLQDVTNTDGSFEIKSVPRRQKVTDLEVWYGDEQRPYVVRLSDFKGTDYNVVRCHYEPTPVVHTIPFEWWSDDPNRVTAQLDCQADQSSWEVKHYTLERSIDKKESGNRIYITVNSVGSVEILDAAVARPLTEPPSYSEQELGENVPQEKTRQWWITMPGQQLDMKIDLCVRLPRSSKPASAAILEGNYFFK